MYGVLNTSYTSVDGGLSYNDSDYVYATAINSGIAVYGLTAPSELSATIDRVHIYARTRSENAAYFFYYNVGFVIGGTIYNGINTSFHDVSWVNRYQTWATNPNTGLSWTWSGVSGISLILTLTSNGSAAVYCSELYAKVDYTLTTTPFIKGIMKTKQIP
jgi:hypothetical protein